MINTRQHFINTFNYKMIRFNDNNYHLITLLLVLRRIVYLLYPLGNYYMNIFIMGDLLLKHQHF